MPYDELDAKYLEAKAVHEQTPPERRGRLVLDRKAIQEFHERQRSKRDEKTK